jgi:hypothetical protein
MIAKSSKRSAEFHLLYLVQISVLGFILYYYSMFLDYISLYEE